jgi:hypothetical protein
MVPLARLRAICLKLPEAHEVEAWGEPTFRVRNKMFAMYASAHTHHGRGCPAVWCKGTPMDQEYLVRSNPRRFFVPPYVGPYGWVGVRLDGKPDWKVVTELLSTAYQRAAPKRLLARGSSRVKTGARTGRGAS